MNPINNRPVLTDGGLETDLIFNRGINLDHFAAFPLIEHPEYRIAIKDYYKEYLEIAKKHKTGFILESPTWRANLDWGKRLGYSKEDLIRINQLAIRQLKALKATYEERIPGILISGQIGPRGDGYRSDTSMNCTEAMEYHKLQVAAFKSAAADQVSAITMTYSEEALGIIKSAQLHGIAVVISFTVELNGNLPSGEGLKDAIQRLDKATANYPMYYMINCAHPSHFVHRLANNEVWKHRIKGVRVNASCKSHEELDASTSLDKGDKKALASWHKILRSHLPDLRVYGGCCGTDASHISAICQELMN